MTEKEYILLSNRINISIAKKLLGHVLVYDEFGAEETDLRNVSAMLSKIENRLFNKLEILENEK